ncbi:MAG: prephenate dehydrogenase/arogenate dehydrogenase family protein [Chlamydiae bacterium]|nr:prephenate dehydrogenase/arogenate dehydrogenase family protein [Chlamydiota bacterium]
MKKFKKILIIGLGLMGGSIEKCLKEKGIEVTLDEKENVDLAVIATPLSTIIPIAKKIKAPLVIDIGSLKADITKAFEEMTSKNFEFVATHPMAGSEKQGYENSQADLFIGASWVITPHKKNSDKNLKKVEHFIELLGAKPLFMDPKIHDRRVALISQLPFTLSKMLFDFVNEKDPESLSMAGPGFKSMTRLKDDNPKMRKEMTLLNEKAFKEFLKEFYEYFTLHHK